MSGRALFPLSINVAAVLSRAFDGKLPISYSGGASQLTIRDIFLIQVFALLLWQPTC